MVYGGRAGLNSVMFYNRSTKVKAIRCRNGRIKVLIGPRDYGNITKFGRIVEKIPFLRGMWLIVELVLVNWKLHTINFCLLSFLLLLQKTFNTEAPENLINSNSYFFTPAFHFFFLWEAY